MQGVTIVDHPLVQQESDHKRVHDARDDGAEREVQRGGHGMEEVLIVKEQLDVVVETGERGWLQARPVGETDRGDAEQRQNGQKRQTQQRRQEKQVGRPRVGAGKAARHEGFL